MRNSNAKDRSPLIWGATIFVTLATILIICCAGRFGANTNDTAKKGSEEICTTTTILTTQTTSTRSNTTTSTAVTSTKTTTVTTKTETASQTETVVTEVQTEPASESTTAEIVIQPTEPVTEPAPEPSEPVAVQEPEIQAEPLPYNESDAILLAQLINKESSIYWDGMIAVADCVINRANINGLTISQVIYAPGQFTTAYSLGYYNADNYNAAVQVLTYGSTNTAIYYFDGNHGGLNWFYDINRNYLFAA